MKPRKKKQKKKPESLLRRLIRGGAGEGKKKKKKSQGVPKNGRSGTPDGARKAKPLTPLERSIKEIKQMTSMGEKDPERLAMILSRLLGSEQEKARLNKEKFDEMVWDIVKRREEEGGGGSDSGASDTR